MGAALVTGAAGFIGSHVADALLSDGLEVVVLDDLSGGFRANVPAGAAFVQASVCDAPAVRRIFERHRIEYVYHLAAYAAEGLSHFIRCFTYSNNVVGSMTLINEAIRARVKCFVFTSSIAVYGAGQIPMGESLTPRPEDPYGIAKYAVELDLQAAHRMFGLPYVVFRPHNVYGERQNIADRYRNVVGLFMNAAMQKKPMKVFGDGRQTRAFSYINDVAPVIARAPFVSAAHGEVFNIGAEQPYTVLGLAEAVADSLQVPLCVEHLPPRIEVEHAVASHEKVRRVFGTAAGTPLNEGLRRMAEWARQRGPQEPSRRQRLEIDENVPEVWT